jgi:ribonuclease J
MSAPDTEELVFLPLGGAGEIGMNLSLYGWGAPGEHRWLMIDCGITFGGDGIPGADVMMPDASFIRERRDRLDGLLLTHAHEDHLGAVPYLWHELRCPVYGTPFALAMLRRKLDGSRLAGELRPIEVPACGRLSIGAFDLELVGMTHSIPEAKAVAIRSKAGLVLHTGDWKLDPDPVVGAVSDEAALRRLGDEGVLAIVCDSTNVFEEGRSGSEGTLLDGLSRIIAGCARRVVVTCFASNVARLHTVAEAARANGRDVVMTGASLKRTYAAARECGYLGDIPPFLEDALAERLPPGRTLIVCTGGQGEPRAALTRIAQNEHPYLSLERGDVVVFSSRVIPGNEPAIGRLQNALLRLGVEIVTHRDGLIHVSGHPARGDLARMYDLVRPRVSVPVHGELRHLLEHARLARERNVPDALVVENGTLVRLAPGPSCIVDHVPVGRRLLEGNRAVPVDGELVRSRAKAIYNGAVVLTVVLTGKGRSPADIRLSSVGLLEEGEDEVMHGICAAARGAVEDLTATQYSDDETVRETVRVAVRRASRQLIDKRPLAHVHVVRV